MTLAALLRLCFETRGAAAAEFALTIPIMASLLTGTMMIGHYLSVSNSLKSALDETARYAAVYPTPTDSQLRARFNAKLTRPIDQKQLVLTINRVSVSTSVKTIELKASYPVPVKFIFAEAGTIDASVSKRKIFSAQ